jgi:hypothetical protein
MDTLDLKGIEDRAYGTRSNNGLLDIVIGLGLLGYGLLADIGAYLVPSYALVIALLLQKFVVTPRVGRVRFAEDRRIRERKGIVLIVLLVLIPIPLGLMLFFADKLEGWAAFVSTNTVLILGLFVALGMFAAGWSKSAARFYIYGIMAVLNFGGAQLFAQPHTWPMMSTGAIITVVGIVLITRFILANPVQKAEAA